MSVNGKTECRVVRMVIPTYPEPEKEKLPMYCETRVHQRTSGRVYPNAIVNNVVRDHKEDREYAAIIIENDFIELIILPELGGRIFAAKDKSNGYDFFYRQHVIKPALIGLFGSWISGGAEFNWPMHHRPSTFMPVDFSIEKEADGGVTVWLSEHEPLDRMKGMLGIRVHPDKAMFETRVRLHNRTAMPNSFLWWENVAVPVNRDYRIFFPQDVNHVHFHYKKSVTAFPVADSMFNGIDYRGGVDVRWHRNTLNSTSYFSARSDYDFFGGFDHGKNAGVVHVADHHISPGKKLFTWGYNQLSKSWERALTDADGAYAELMAGVYTDNQPDFSWIEPCEVKEFSQYWYPFKEIGEPKNANTHAALNYHVESDRVKLMLYAVHAFGNAKLEVECDGKIVQSCPVAVAAGQVFKTEFSLSEPGAEDKLFVRLLDGDGNEIITYRKTALLAMKIPEPAKALPSPSKLANAEDLFLAGLHTRQYRDPLANPDVYWKRALELEPGHYESNVALGQSALKAGRFGDATACFRSAIATLTKFNPNPRDGEAFYALGLALKYQGDFDGAYDAFYKSIWNYKWRSAGYYSLARIDCVRNDRKRAREHLKEALKTNSDNQQAANLLAATERSLGNTAEAMAIVRSVLSSDPLDYWAMNEFSLLRNCGGEMFESMKSDPSQTVLDVVFDYCGAGLFADAANLIARFIKFMDGRKISPMIYYVYGHIMDHSGDAAGCEQAWQTARAMNPDYCFPSRLEEMIILQDIVAKRKDPRAAYYLGNLLYGKGRHAEATLQWEKALQMGEDYYVLYRNLGLACYNGRGDGEKALEFVRRALELKPRDPQLIFELNYLMQLLNCPFEERLDLLQNNLAQVNRRDDLYMELVRVNNQLGNCEKAVELLKTHVFTPCEGGEHALAELWIFAHFKPGRLAYNKGEYRKALEYFRQGQVLPDNLGAGVWNICVNIPCRYHEALCLDHLDKEKALSIYRYIVGMGLDYFSYMYQPALDYYRAMAFKRLGESNKGDALLRECVNKWEAEKAQKDYGYFRATPFFLSYFESPEDARKQHYGYLLGLAHAGLGDNRLAAECFAEVLKIHSGHLWAELEKSRWRPA